MKTYKYKARNGNIQYKPSLSWLMGEVKSDNMSGFCVGCGSEHDCVEPDARKYHCTDCNAHKVYGCEELLLMGLYASNQSQPDNRSSRDYGDPRAQVAD